VSTTRSLNKVKVLSKTTNPAMKKKGKRREAAETIDDDVVVGQRGFLLQKTTSR
jgi:hypothetical protein